MIMTSLLDEDLAYSLVEKALEADIVAIDTETNYWKKSPTPRDVRDGTGHACGISIAYRNATGMIAFFLPFRYQSLNYSLDRFRPVIQRIVDNKPLTFHNAKHDLVSLTTLGVDTSRARFFCTMLMAHLVNENLISKSLDYCAKYFLKNDGKHLSPYVKAVTDNLGWDMVPPIDFAEYASVDAALHLELFEHLLPKIKKENLGQMWLHKEKFTRLIMKMESKGVLLDTEFSTTKMEQGLAIMERLREELGGFNPASPKDLYQLLCVQLGLPEIINPKTKRRTFDKNAMAKYEEVLQYSDNPTARRILEYRGYQKTVSSNYRAYLELLSPDGRLRPNYKMHGTKTGRMSCEKPNLQQIPRESPKPWNGDLKKAFVASPGRTLYEFDYAQLELRLGTAYAEEPHLVEVFREDRDIFTEMANRIGMSRQDTKTLVYAIQYGAGVPTISLGLGISPAKARQRIDDYYEAYPAFRNIQQKVNQTVLRYGKAPLWSGRFRHFENPKEEYYKAFNSVIQGGAADIVERVMLHIDGLDLPGTDLLLQVHDSIVLEIDDDHAQDVVPEIERQMAQVDTITGQDFKGVRFKAESKVWGT